MESCCLSRNHSASSAVILCVAGGQPSATCLAHAASALAQPIGLKSVPTAVKVKFFFFPPLNEKKVFPNSLQPANVI